jgi:hypothetical protein
VYQHLSRVLFLQLAQLNQATADARLLGDLLQQSAHLIDTCVCVYSCFLLVYFKGEG